MKRIAKVMMMDGQTPKGCNMSNRINELIEECTSVYDDMIYDGRDTRWKTTEYFDKQKFAERIIKECIVLLSEDDGATHHNELLSDHFGMDQC